MAIGFGMSGWGGVGDDIEGGGGGGDGAGAIVTNYQPDQESQITPSTPIEFDIVFSGDPVAVIVWVLYDETGASEMVYSSRDGFAVNFRPQGNFLGSTKSEPAFRVWHFKLRRRSGWFATPTIRVEGGAGGGAIQQP